MLTIRKTHSLPARGITRHEYLDSFRVAREPSPRVRRERLRAALRAADVSEEELLRREIAGLAVRRQWAAQGLIQDVAQVHEPVDGGMALC